MSRFDCLGTRMGLGISLAASLAVLAPDASGLTISTFDPGGADAEVREETPTDNRGAVPELASRVAAGAVDRNTHIYMKWRIRT